MPTRSTPLATAILATSCLLFHAPLKADSPVAKEARGAGDHAAGVTTEKKLMGKKPYLGIPYHDSIHHGGPQVIPGRLENEYYDTMDVSAEQKAAGAEEGVTYHDTDKINSGSGTLNGKGSYRNEFRMFESPDISYVKFDHAGVQIDDSAFNCVKPDADGIYLGWIAPGEWVNYTVVVQRAGTYSITTSYTSKFGGHISFDSDGNEVSGPIEIPSTFDQADPVEWRQAHHWNKITHVGKLRLKEGVQVLTLHFIDQPVMNFDYMEFVREE